MLNLRIIFKFANDAFKYNSVIVIVGKLLDHGQVQVG